MKALKQIIDDIDALYHMDDIPDSVDNTINWGELTAVRDNLKIAYKKRLDKRCHHTDRYVQDGIEYCLKCDICTSEEEE